MTLSSSFCCPLLPFLGGRKGKGCQNRTPHTTWSGSLSSPLLSQPRCEQVSFEPFCNLISMLTNMSGNSRFSSCRPPQLTGQPKPRVICHQECLCPSPLILYVACSFIFQFVANPCRGRAASTSPAPPIKVRVVFLSTSNSHARDEGEEAPLTQEHSWKVLVELPALVPGGHSPYPILRKKPRGFPNAGAALCH